MKWFRRLRLVDDVRRAWRWSSIWVTIISGAVLSAWEAMPGSLQSRLPPWAPIAVSALIVLSRITTLKAPEAVDEAN